MCYTAICISDFVLYYKHWTEKDAFLEIKKKKKVYKNESIWFKKFKTSTICSKPHCYGSVSNNEG